MPGVPAGRRVNTLIIWEVGSGLQRWTSKTTRFSPVFHLEETLILGRAYPRCFTLWSKASLPLRALSVKWEWDGCREGSPHLPLLSQAPQFHGHLLKGAGGAASLGSVALQEANLSFLPRPCHEATLSIVAGSVPLCWQETLRWGEGIGKKRQLSPLSEPFR